MKSETRSLAVKYIESMERFSPASLCEDLNLSITEGVFVCEDLHLTQPDRYKKWYRIICPSCGSIANADTFSNVEEVEYCNCTECLHGFYVEHSDIRVYYSNEVVKKKSSSEDLAVPDSDVKIQNVDYEKNQPDTDIDLSILNLMNNPQDDSFLKMKKGFIWHISDLHFKDRRMPFRPGHSKELMERFVDLLKKRGSLIENDWVVISGDLTDSGSTEDYREFQVFFEKLISLGLKRQQVLGVPGNHDSWGGIPFFIIWISYLIPERILFKLNKSYRKRKYSSILENFNSRSSEINRFKLNDRDIELIRVNSTLNLEMARGIFPNDARRPEDANSLKILVMHHHLIKPDHKKFDYGSTYIKAIFHSIGMRVINAAIGLTYLEKCKIDISLHGHKHVQYFKREHAINTATKGTLISSSPSLTEDSFDFARGNCSEHNTIGLNIVIPSRRGSDLIQLKLKDWYFEPEMYLNG